MDTLHEAERDFSAVRQSELSNMGVTGDFSLKHMCSIHKQLFQDVYSWAGKTRTVDISKGTIFCLVQFIESQFDDLYRKLKKENFLSDISDEQEMSKRLAYYLGELNMIHPFREGNGRTQRISNKDSFKKIGKLLHRHPSTIAHEIKENRTFIPGNYFLRKDCRFVRQHVQHHICGDESCEENCCRCRRMDCQKYCEKYVSRACHGKADAGPESYDEKKSFKEEGVMAKEEITFMQK